MSTIKQVADLAGVSVGTVSHVITGSVPVSESLVQRVQAAIRDLDYHPNHIARSLKTSKTKTLGMIVPDMLISFFPHLIHGAEMAARACGYSLIAVNSGDSAERQNELFTLLRSQRVEGVLLVMAAGPTPVSQMTRMMKAGIAVVCLDRIPEGVRVDSISIENAKAAKLAVNHLIANGHRRIAFVTGSLKLKNERRRFMGYKHALELNDIAIDDALIWPGEAGGDHITRLCIDRLSDAARRPDAIISTNGPTGLAVLRALRASGLKTPEDLAFVTFDELTPHDLFSPSITTIVQPAYDIGHKAASVLMSRIEQQLDPAQLISIRFRATLIIRESSARSEKDGARRSELGSVGFDVSGQGWGKSADGRG